MHTDSDRKDDNDDDKDDALRCEIEKENEEGKEKFILKKDLYPGEYIIGIAEKIIKSNKNEKS